MNAIYAKIEGSTVVRWNERRPHGHRHRPRQFSNRQDHFNILTQFITAGNGDPTEIAEGRHVYRFSCPLPDTLPTSFEGSYGSIRYTITTVVERPSNQNSTFREALTVLRHVNLNNDPSLRKPKKLELSKSFGWWIFKSDPLNIAVEIPFTGYVPGQYIPVAVRWNNNSSAYISGIRIKLFKNEVYFATDPYEKQRTNSQCVVKIENRDEQKQEQASFQRNLLIPSTPPTSSSNLITIAYELAVYIHISTGEIPEFNVPITVGTIPLLDFPSASAAGDDSDQPPSPPQPPAYGFKVAGTSSDHPPNKAGAPSTSQTATPTASSTEELPPPTYEEAMNVAEVDPQEQDEQPTQEDSLSFIPRYPVYNFGETSDKRQ
ncbi:arrestin domain-containing protein 4-like isoform X2 [Toxorhynchites rutilus septentrionalis]|uniref:arrestin domain-containing protein 4-like isoform X2 n=1 Tax=Toxorhynchites rutilus septentrionalis TaxID=329112 RepID=UPI00247A9F54|nr:arrestin domain-containing protein 4-like isoform X2 [Toxorhynchites rutilus septentrionalis]